MTQLKTAFPRFKNEIVPFDVAIKGAWIDKCEPELLESVVKDLVDIHRLQFRDKTPETGKKLYVATAGGPCSGKSTELDFEIFESKSDDRYDNLIFVDPDRYTMEYMNYTYRPMMSAWQKAVHGVEEAARIAYDRARPGSNIISNLLFNEAFDGGFNIAHGTTMTGPHIGSMLDNLGKAGYERRLLLCMTPNDVRIEAGNKRINKEAHYQVDPSDFVAKGSGFFERMGDYFRHGDEVVLLFKDDVEQKAVLAAIYRDGNGNVINNAAFHSFVNQYEMAANISELPSFEEIEQIYFDRFRGPAVSSAPRHPSLS